MADANCYAGSISTPDNLTDLFRSISRVPSHDFMADDKDHKDELKMTNGAHDLNLDDDNLNGAENAEAEDLNDDPEEDDVSPEEFAALNSQMDQLNSALDVLEEQNDIIHAKLMDLLESNRAARKQFKEEQEKEGSEKPSKSMEKK